MIYYYEVRGVKERFSVDTDYPMSDAELVAEDAAKDFWFNRRNGGVKWPIVKWPIRLSLFLDENSDCWGTYWVLLRHEPTFIATSADPSPAPEGKDE